MQKQPLIKFDAEAEITPEKQQENLENHFVNLFVELPPHSQKRVLCKLWDRISPEPKKHSQAFRDLPY